jgi:hypothetical protein
MNLLTDILCSMADILRLKIQVESKYLAAKIEDGAKSLHSCAKQLCFWWAILVFCIVLLASGVGFIMWGAYALLASAINPGFAALIVGLIVSLIAITVLSVVKSSIK